MAALFAGRFAGAGDLTEVSRAARGLGAVHSPQPAALVLDALTLLVTDGPSAAAPALRQVARVFASDSISTEEELRWGWLAQAAASAVWDDVPWRTMLLRQVQLARDVGALDQLPVDLGALGTDAAWTRRLRDGRGPDRGDRCGLCRDREPQRALRRHAARFSSGRPGRGRPR